MINRILIRIKVVQMLYSYLLTRSEFKIDDAPESVSREKRYSYLVYLDMLMLILELSGYSSRIGEPAALRNIAPKLAANRAAKALNINNAVRSAILRNAHHSEIIREAAKAIYNKVANSAVFADYSRKRNPELADDVQLWIAILDTIVARDETLIEALRQEGDYTNRGFLQGIEQVKNTLRSYVDSRQFYLKARTDLETSLNKAYELYLNIFQLILDITSEQERRLDNAKNKLMATSDDLNPNTALVDNKLVAYLRNSASFALLLDEHLIKPADVGTPIIKILLDKITESEIYKKYIDQHEHTLQSDAEFWRDALRYIVFNNEDFLEFMEDKSVFWNDDLQTMGDFALKTIRRIGASEGMPIEVTPKFKDSDAERFGPELFLKAVEHQDEYRHYIDMFVEKSSWDPERLAYMDVVIMTTAIAEIINFPAIPAPVSVNEYVEIANSYSTEKSGGFINGILYSIIKYLNTEGIIHKS